MSQLINLGSGGGGGAVDSVSGGTNISTSGTATDPVIDLDATITLTTVNATAAMTAGTGITITTGDLDVTSGSVNLPTTTSTDGQITINGNRFMHANGSNNTFLGSFAGNLSSSGSGQNVGIGTGALDIVSTGFQNVAVGYNSLGGTTTGEKNIAIGCAAGAGLRNSSDRNTFIGYSSAGTMSNNGGSSDMVTVGHLAMARCSQNASGGVFIGSKAAEKINGNHIRNTVVGAYAFSKAVGLGYPSSDTPRYNTMIGTSSGNNMTGDIIRFNTLIGYASGSLFTTIESSNIIIGSRGTIGDNNTIRIGNSGSIDDQQDKTFIAGIYNTTPSGGADNVVVIDSNGQLGAQTSLDVANGGTGAATLTDHGVLFGSAATAITASAELTDGQLLIGDTGADPVLATLTAGTGIGITNAAGAITVASTGTTLNAQTGTTYTLVLTDAGKLVTADNAAAIALTVPPNSSVAFPLGTRISVIQKGAGVVTITAGSGVTINSRGTLIATNGQFARVELVKESTDVWYLSGDRA